MHCTTRIYYSISGTRQQHQKTGTEADVYASGTPNGNTDARGPTAQIVEQARIRSEYHESYYKLLFGLCSTRCSETIGVIQSLCRRIHKHDEHDN